MKTVKKGFYLLMILCMILCAFVVICALIPGLTDQIAIKLYGEKSEESLPNMENNVTVYPDHTISGVTMAGLNWDDMPFRENAGYVVPGKDEIAAPEEVRGKSGYQGIQEKASEVAEEEALEISEELGRGALGDEYTFYDLYYPYYAMLQPDMQELYRQIYANANQLTRTFQPVVEVTEQELYSVFEAVTGDHPELFWLETGYSCKKTRSGQIVEITLQYYDIVNRLDAAKREFDQAAEMILGVARGKESELEKEQAVHDALAEKADYVLSAQMNQSAYSALVNGETVCAGYARAFQYLMQQLGIPCYYCTGYSGEDHAWNIIYVDGLFRNVDLTWDDGETLSYEYYNCSDKEFAKTHMRKGLSVFLPACPEEGTEMAEVSALDGIRGLINPNPIKPITLDDPGEIFPEATPAENTGNTLDEKELKEAGITASEVMTNMENYYKNCGEQMASLGVGQIRFSNCIPAALWDQLETAYSSGAYKEGYVNEALNKMQAEQFAITIQAVKLSDGYYRLYHIVATW